MKLRKLIAASTVLLSTVAVTAPVATAVAPPVVVGKQPKKVGKCRPPMNVEARLTVQNCAASLRFIRAWKGENCTGDSVPVFQKKKHAPYLSWESTGGSIYWIQRKKGNKHYWVNRAFVKDGDGCENLKARYSNATRVLVYEDLP